MLLSKIFGTFKAKAAAAGLVALGAAALLAGGSGDGDQAYKNAVKGHDSYVVNLNVAREGYKLRRSTNLSSGYVSQGRDDWKYGPTTISSKLVRIDHDTDYGYGNSGAMHALSVWEDKIEQWKDLLRHPSKEPYSKEIYKVLNEAEDLQGDVDLVLRVLNGIRVFGYEDDPDRFQNADYPLSGMPNVYFHGAQTTNTSSDYSGTKIDDNAIQPWSPETPADQDIARRLGEDYQLMVWHYSKEDMERVDKLIQKIDSFEKRLQLDESAFNKRKADPEQVGYFAKDIRLDFHHSFVIGLMEVSRLAWWYVPSRAPDSFWARSAEEVHPFYDAEGFYDRYYDDERVYEDFTFRLDMGTSPYPKKDVDLSLPELPATNLMALRMPLRGLTRRDHPSYYNRYNIRGKYDPYSPKNETWSVRSVNGPTRHEFLALEEGHDLSDIYNPHQYSVIHGAFDGARLAGQFTIRDDYEHERKSESGETLYFDKQFQDYTIDWAIEAGAEICDTRDCFPKEEKETPDYKAPPVLAMEAKSLPEVPVPGMEAALGFRIQNNSDIIASAVSLELRLLNVLTQKAPDDLVPHNEFCKTTSKDVLLCEFGDMAPGAVADIMFGAKTPDNGLFFWSGDFSSKGDLGGRTNRIGTLGELVKPQILEVVVVNDQTAFEDEMPVYTYPFASGSDGFKVRTLFVVGKNLPDEKKDVSFKNSEDVRYFLEAFEDTDNPDHNERIQKGWMKYFATDDPVKALAQAKKEGLEGVLVDTRLQEGVMPGKKKLNLNGADGYWDLQFGDITADLYFVRYVEKEPFDLLNNAYAPGRVYLVVQTNMALPIDSISVNLDLKGSGVKGAKTQKIDLKRADYIGKKVYLSKPLDLHTAGGKPSLQNGIGIPVTLGKNKSAYLSASIDSKFTADSFLLASPVAKAEIDVWETPASQKPSWLWHDALKRAASCYKDKQGVNVETIGAAESKPIWNLIILTTSEHFPEQSVKFGQHAATILLRDMYIKIARGQNEKYRKILNNRTAIDGFMKVLRSKIHDKTIPILRMKVPGLDGLEREYRWAIMNDPEWIAEKYGRSVDDVERHRKKATKAAIRRLIEQSEDAIEEAEDAKDCDVEDLVLLTGFNFEPVARALKSEMVTEAETRLSDGSQHTMWTSDATARYWVDQVAPLARAVKEQEKRADIDTDLTLAVVGIAAMPLMLAENAFISMIAFGLDLLDFGVTTVHEIDQYLDSRTELIFSRGAAIIIGEDRYKKAQEDAKAWYSTAFGTALSGLGAITGAIDAIPKAVSARRVARGRVLTPEIENPRAINELSDADRNDFAAFAMTSYTRRAALGPEYLTVAERRAIALVDQYASGKMATKIESEMDLPPAQLIDSYIPADPIKFAVDESVEGRKFEVGENAQPRAPPKELDSEALSKPNSNPLGKPPAGFDFDAPSVPNANPLGKAPEGFNFDAPSLPVSGRVRIEPAPSGNINDIVFSDDIPSRPDIRIPDDTAVTVRNAEKGEFELELGARVGKPGATSEAFALPGAEEDYVIRITYLREGSSAVELDTFGEDVLRNKITSEHVRAPEIKDKYDAAPGRFRREDSGSFSEAVRVTTVERVTPAHEILRKGNRGRLMMTDEQGQAFVNAMRDLNAHGYVWLDNKPDNFAFVRADSGKIQVVILDPGGIVPVKQSYADFLGITKADLARQIQLRVNGTFETHIPEFSYMKATDIAGAEQRSITRYGIILEDYGDAIDLKALGIDDINKLWFNPLSGEMFDYLSPIFEAAAAKKN